MNILGLYAAGLGHDTCAALVKDGKLVAAAEEERFDRVKHTSAPPVRAAKFCLDYANLSLDDIDYIAVGWDPSLWLRRNALSSIEGMVQYFIQSFFRLFRRETSQGGAISRAKIYRKKFRPIERYWYNEYVAPTVKRTFDEIRAKVIYFEHHLAHAAASFYTSGFKDASIVTIDAQGELNSTVLWQGIDNSIEKIREESEQNSLGFFYEEVTNYLGLGWLGAGKTMGLAPYGEPSKEMMEKIEAHIDLNAPLYRRKIKFLRSDILGFPPRTTQSPLEKEYRNLAYCAQDFLERAILKCVEYVIRRTNIRTCVLGGGVALNCTANSRIINSGLVEDLHIFPATNDGGVAVGAALACAAMLGEKPKFKLTHAYWGPEFSCEKIETMLKNNKIKYEKYDDIAGITAELLAKGKIVGWFQGRMEIGPRALGNRSILADPTKKEMWSTVNKIKGREPWRPLAPSILLEAIDEYFEKPRESPFMLLTFKVKESERKKVPAIVHVDGTTRPQTVTK
ncbi:MAG: carbamoyltransferase N-terminal domain-containing protein, partial [Candidatus Hadarchaeales archaeon]